MKLFLNKEGRLGNILIKYFFGYVLSKKLNCEFYTRFKHNVPFLTEYYSDHSVFDTCLYENWSGDNYELFLDDKKITKDLNSIVSALIECKKEFINVAGYYQNIDYYTPYVDEIRTLIKDNKYFFEITKDVPKNATGILIRKGDIINSPHELPDEWYLSMAKKHKTTPIYFSTDTIQHPVCQKLMHEYGAKFIQASALDTILIFSQFKNLVLSQGTFSWWAGFLNENNIYSMISTSGWNSDSCDVNLKTPWWNWLKLEEV